MEICYNRISRVALVRDNIGGNIMRTKSRNIENIIANVSATLAVEGLRPSCTAISINRKYLEGKISSEEAIAKIKAKYLKVTVD
jgi:hypothetical protein